MQKLVNEIDVTDNKGLQLFIWIIYWGILYSRYYKNIYNNNIYS